MKKENKITTIGVIVKDGNIEQALGILKKKFKKAGIVRALQNRMQFNKPSVEKRLKKQKAIRNQQLNNLEEQ